MYFPGKLYYIIIISHWYLGTLYDNNMKIWANHHDFRQVYIFGTSVGVFIYCSYLSWFFQASWPPTPIPTNPNINKAFMIFFWFVLRNNGKMEVSSRIVFSFYTIHKAKQKPWQSNVSWALIKKNITMIFFKILVHWNWILVWNFNLIPFP